MSQRHRPTSDTPTQLRNRQFQQYDLGQRHATVSLDNNSTLGPQTQGQIAHIAQTQHDFAAEQDERIIPREVDTLENILRFANNLVGLDSRDNMLSARPGDRQISLSFLIRQAARKMDGTPDTVIMCLGVDYEALLAESDRFKMERDQARAERDRALADLGDLQEKYNEECVRSNRGDSEHTV